MRHDMPRITLFLIYASLSMSQMRHVNETYKWDMMCLASHHVWLVRVTACLVQMRHVNQTCHTQKLDKVICDMARDILICDMMCDMWICDMIRLSLTWIIDASHCVSHSNETCKWDMWHIQIRHVDMWHDSRVFDEICWCASYVTDSFARDMTQERWINRHKQATLWFSSTLQVCCSVLQCVAVCCSVLQCVVTSRLRFYSHRLFKCVTVCHSVL